MIGKIAFRREMGLVVWHLPPELESSTSEEMLLVSATGESQQGHHTKHSL